MSVDALRLTFEIACSKDHAFDVWTTRLSSWWPRDHSASGHPDTVVTLEPRLGGRIFECTPDGHEIDWGEVTVWSPPDRLVYLWHIGRERAVATTVDLTFVDTGDETTRLEIVHSGWERLGPQAVSWRDANTNGWRTLLPAFTAAAEA